ncbi:tail fiber domain-containing protein [Haliea sp. E17]|uniref:tail fiber domain-containing protein n=1 Tax=Haliea sp. E17 TaxID=3401576 RepID=UPI003AB0B452
MSTALQGLAYGGSATAVGYASRASDAGSAFGVNARATALRSTALGVTTSADFENSTAVGFGARTTAANMVRIGNTGVTKVEGQVAFSSSSDRRLKQDVKPSQLGLEFINDLTPVQYRRINDPNSGTEFGLIAQDLQAALERNEATDSSMVSVSENDGMMSVRYNDLIAPMIAAIQELSEQNRELRQRLQVLESGQK